MKSIFFRSIFPVKKLPGRKGVKYAHPSGIKDLISKAGRSTRDATYKRLLKKHPTSSRSAIRAFKIANIKEEKKITALTKKFGVESQRVLKTEFKSKGEWSFKEPFIESKKLRRFKTYIKPKVSKKLSQTKKTFLRDDDPSKALKSMRLDKEGSHMKGLPSEPRNIKGVADVVDLNYPKFKKRQLTKMAASPIPKITDPKRLEKLKIRAKGKEGLSKFIDLEVKDTDLRTIVTKKHAIKHGKKYTKAYGKFSVRAKKVGGSLFPIGKPEGIYKWRKGRKHKILVIE